MLQKGVALLVLAFIAGCGSATTGKPERIERHLVYEKLIGETGIWIADVDGSQPRLLVPEGRGPVISPDGKWVAYSVQCSAPDAPGCEQAYVVSTTVGEEPRLFAKGVIGGSMTWSPDSERIVTLRSLSDELVSIDVPDGKEVTLLAHGAIRDWSISPDGSQIVFAAVQSPSDEGIGAEKIDLFVTGRDGGDAKRITDDGNSGYPVWGPKSIAFSKLIWCLPPAPKDDLDGCRKNYTWGRHEIWQVQPDGTQRRSIIGPLPKRFQMQGCVGLIPIDWSGDGRALLAAWACEFSHEPVAVDPETGEARALGWGSDTVALSADGRFALAQAGTGAETADEDQTVLIDAFKGGKPDVVARGAVYPSWNR